MVISKRFWNKKKIFITGHNGFKGSWISLILYLLNCELYGYALKPKKKSLFNILKLNKIFKKIYIEDIRNFKKLEKAILNSRPSIIIHMAAQSLVGSSYSNPRETYDINFNGTLNLLEILRINFVKSILLVVTTDKVYRPNYLKYYKEDDPIGGIDPYSSSKSCIENLVYAYSKILNSKIKLISARAGNVIGGGDWSEKRLFPDIVRNIYENKKLIIRNKKSVRPWQHVIEPLNGYIIALQFVFQKFDSNYIAINFGPNKSNEINVEQVIKLINKNYNKKIKYKISKKELFKEEKILKLNSNKAKKILNWKSVLGIEKSIDLTLKWYNVYFNSRSKISKFTLDQISNYLILK